MTEKDIFARWEQDLLQGNNMENLKSNTESQVIVPMSIPCQTIYRLICEIRAYRDGLREKR